MVRLCMDKMSERVKVFDAFHLYFIYGKYVSFLGFLKMYIFFFLLPRASEKQYCLLPGGLNLT